MGAQAEKTIKSIHEATNGAILAETFLESELVVNVTEHILVPKHYLLSADEKAELLEHYKAKEFQLPRILTKDPVAKYLGLCRGDVVKIVRSSETAGHYVTYRI